MGRGFDEGERSWGGRKIGGGGGSEAPGLAREILKHLLPKLFKTCNGMEIYN